MYALCDKSATYEFAMARVGRGFTATRSREVRVWQHPSAGLQTV